MTKMTLVIEIYLSNIKSNDPNTMLYGGEGFLFKGGNPPIKTTHKKTLYKLHRNETKKNYVYKNKLLPKFDSASTHHIPSHYLRIESTFYLDINPRNPFCVNGDETTYLAKKLSFAATKIGRRWCYMRWTHNILNNDVILDTNNPNDELALVIKKVNIGTAGFAYETYEPDYIVQPTSPIKNAYLMDHLNQIYPLSALKMQSYCDWSDIPSQYI